MIKTLKTVTFLLPRTFYSISFVGSTTPWATSWAAQNQDIYYLKGDPPKKDLVNLKVKPSIDLAKLSQSAINRFKSSRNSVSCKCYLYQISKSSIFRKVSSAVDKQRRGQSS
jgi:hypothetical protein